MQCMNMEQNNKLLGKHLLEKRLLASWGKKKEITRRREKRKKKGRAFAHPCLELSPFMLSNTVYQPIVVT